MVVVNDYTATDDMAGADLVLDGVHAGAGVVDDPHGLAPALPLEQGTLERLLAVG